MATYEIWNDVPEPNPKPADKIKAAFDASGLAAMGYSQHIRAAEGGMVIYTSMDNPVAVKVYLTSRGEVQAELYNILNYSLIKTSIADIAFPHPHLMSFIKQLSCLDAFWMQNWQSMR